MPNPFFRELSPQEKQQIYIKIASQTNREIFESEVVRSLFLTIILFAFRIVTDRTEQSLERNIITVVTAYVLILFFSYILAIIERRFARRKLKGIK